MTVVAFPQQPAAPDLAPPAWEQYEDRVADQCVIRGATIELIRHPEAIRQAYLKQRVRQWGPDMIVRTAWRYGVEEVFFVDNKSQLEYRPGPAGLAWTINDDAFRGMFKFMKFADARPEQMLFSFVLHKGGTPYVADLTEAAVLAIHWGDGFRRIDVIDGLRTLDTVLGPPRPTWALPPDAAVHLPLLKVALVLVGVRVFHIGQHGEHRLRAGHDRLGGRLNQLPLLGSRADVVGALEELHRAPLRQP